MRLVQTCLALTLGLALPLAGGAADRADPAAAPRPLDSDSGAGSLSVAVARARTVEREYRLDGVVEAVQRTTVSAQTQGQVEAILYDVDDFVMRDAVIARLRDTEHRARVAQAAAELKAAAAQLAQAQDEHARVKGLYDKKNVSDSAMDQAVANLKSASARLESAQAGLEQAQEQLDYTLIRAPYSGIVTHRHIEVGEVASPGQAVMSGISLEQLRVAVDVPQSVIPAVREIGEVRVYRANGTRAATGKVTVFPFADMGSNTFKVRIELVGRQPELFPGMFVKTGFVTGKKQELTVPRAAVVYRSEVTGVYAVAPDGGIQFRLIRPGRVLDEELVVLSGLTEGERVALDPIAAGVALKAQSAVRRAARGGHADG